MDDWDTVTKIGSKTRGSGGGTRETVVRGKSALNAAQRSGVISGTEKKFGTANSSAKGGSDGQRMTKVDRSDDIIAPKTVGKTVGKLIQNARLAKTPTWTRKYLAERTCTIGENELTQIESGEAPYNAAKLLKLQSILQIKLTGNESELGTPFTFGPKKKAGDQKAGEKKAGEKKAGEKKAGEKK